MSLALDRPGDWTSIDDRRAPAVQQRRSWASLHPFERRTTPHNAAPASARRWADVAVGYQRRVVATDAGAALVVAGVVLTLVYGSRPQTAGTVALVAVAFVALITLAHGYETKVLGEGPTEFQALVRAGAAGAVLLMAGSYALHAEVSRFAVFAGVPALVAVALAGRYAHRWLLRRERARGTSMRSTLVVGEAELVRRVVADLGRDSHHGYRVVGVCLHRRGAGEPDVGVPVLGALADIAQSVADHAVEVVVVAGSSLSGEALRRLSWALDRAGTQLIVAPGLVEVTGPRLTLRPTAGLPLLEVEVGAPRGRMLAKAGLDRVVGTVLLLAALPVVLAAAVAVRIGSPGPAFYRQSRVGVDGQAFTMWKLRSMYVDADARRQALAALSDGDGVLFKMRADPRVTAVGRVLRRYSLDELPQLLNVVKGDMSLVGPRPPLAEEVAAYADEVHRRLRVKPGLTGLWQVSGRSDLSWEEAVRLDLRYVDNWSITMDLLILWKTARAVVRASGAY